MAVFEKRGVRGYLTWEDQLKLIKKRKFKNKAFEKYRKGKIAYEKRLEKKLTSGSYLFNGLLSNYTMRTREESLRQDQRNELFFEDSLLYFRRYVVHDNFASIEDHNKYIKNRSLAARGRVELRNKKGKGIKILGYLYRKPIKQRIILLYSCPECNIHNIIYDLYIKHINTLMHLYIINKKYGEPIGPSTSEALNLERGILSIDKKIEDGKITYEEYEKLQIERKELALKLEQERKKGPGVLKRKGVAHPFPELAPKEKKKPFRRGPGWFSKETLLKTLKYDIPPEAYNTIKTKSPRRKMRRVVNNGMVFEMERKSPEYIKSPDCSPEAFIFPKYDDSTYNYVEFSPFFSANINLIDQ